MKTTVLLGLLLSLNVGLADSGRAQEAAARIDERPALEIGSYRVSHYLVEKYFHRFLEDTRARTHRLATAEESRSWLELFVARQIVLAQLRDRGFLERPEVVRAVERMERHMLTQPEGPLYQRIFASQPPWSPEGMRRRYQDLFTASDCVILKFADLTRADSALGVDFIELPAEEQNRRVEKYRVRPISEVVQKTLSWPFSPLEEIGDALSRAPVGRWISHAEPGFGVYYIFKRRVKTVSAGDYTKDEKTFSQHVRFVDSQIAVRRRHNLLLGASGMRVDEEAVAQIARILRPILTVEEQIPEEPFTAMGATPLFSYRVGANPRSVNVHEFVDYVNGLFVRNVPRTEADIRMLAEKMTIEELDVGEARAQGLDRTPQFGEDRKGYAGLLALELYEKEERVPQINITESDIENYYSTHREEFLRIDKIKGRLLTFDRAENAAAWQQKRQGRPTDPPPTDPAPLSDREIQLRRGESMEGFERLGDLPFRVPERWAIGPVQQGKIYACFWKQENVEIGAAPLDEVRPSIHRILMRSRLDQHERALATELSARFEVKDNIDYSRYENDRAQLELPPAT